MQLGAFLFGILNSLGISKYGKVKPIAEFFIDNPTYWEKFAFGFLSCDLIFCLLLIWMAMKGVFDEDTNNKNIT